MFARVYNMHTYKAEQFYFRQYFSYIEPCLAPGMKILDIGCQYGRFTIPLAERGYDITATDLNDKFFKYISKKLPHNKISFRKEGIQTTINELQGWKFDLILCLELLYYVPDAGEILRNLKTLLSDKGIIVISYRSMGYYIYRYIKQKKFEDIDKLLSHTHSDYNAWFADELMILYESSGLEIISMNGVGLFSGYENDPFADIYNPAKADNDSNRFIYRLENDNKIQQHFLDNSRYILVIAKKS